MENFKFTQKFQYILLKAKDLIKKKKKRKYNITITPENKPKTIP